LGKFADYAMADVVGTLDDVAAAADDRAIREKALRMKIRTAEAFSQILVNPDPRQGFVHGWVQTAHARHGLTEGDLRTAFGEHQGTVLALTDRLLEEFALLGRRHLGADAVEAAQADVEAVAADPARALRLLGRGPGGADEADQEGWGLSTLVHLPMAPLTGLQGVADTPAAVTQVALAVQGFTDVVMRWPERVRWQVDALLLELGLEETRTRLLEDVDRFAATAESVARTADQLPADVRAEIETAVEKGFASLDQAQPQLQATLKEARMTVEAASEALVAADKVVGSVDETVAGFTRAAQAWEQTARAAEAVIAEATGPEGPGDPAEPPGQPIDPAQLVDLAERTERVLQDARALIADLKGPMADSSALGETMDRAQHLAGCITWYAIAVIAALFVAAVAYTWIAAKVARRRTPL
jgi:hypothetical protein